MIHRHYLLFLSVAFSLLIHVQAQVVAVRGENALVAPALISNAQTEGLKAIQSKAKALSNRVDNLKADASKKGATIVVQADLIDAQADLMQAKMDEMQAKERLANSLQSPATEAQFRAMELDMIKAKNIKDREAIRNRLNILRRQERERIAAQIDVATR